MFLCFRVFSRKHGRILGRISEGAMERSLFSTNLDEKRVVSTSLPDDFREFSIPYRNQDVWKMAFHTTSSLLIQISSLRRNNNVFTSVIFYPFHLVSRYSDNRVLSSLKPSHITCVLTRGGIRPTHQTRRPFYITPCQQKNPALRENYASELHQAMMLRLLKVGRTSCYRMVGYGRDHFIFFRIVIFLCMKNWGKIDLFRTTWTRLWRLCAQKNSIIDGVPFYIH